MKELILEESNIRSAYRKTLKGEHKYKIQSIKFQRNETKKLINLIKVLNQQMYIPSNYNKFYVYYPKERLIFSPSYQDKIVHHAVNNILRDRIEPKFIYDSYSCIRNKGNHRAVRRIYHFCKAANNLYKDPYIISIDIVKFFYSINHRILKLIVDMEIHCDWVKWILFSYIDTAPTDTGLPLGNLLSQLLVNMFMNILDQYIKRTLKIKYYVRYSDDLFLVVDGKHTADMILEDIRNVLGELKLKTHPTKTKIIPLSKGIESLGFHISPKAISIPNNKIRILRKYLKSGTDEQITSYVSHLKTATTYKNIYPIISSYNRHIIINKGNEFKKVSSYSSPE